MVSVMGKLSEVFGRCVVGIDVSVEAEYGDDWICCEQKYLRFVLAGKAPQDCLQRWVRVPGIGSAFRCFWLD
jgi:hypothetical protein